VSLCNLFVLISLNNLYQHGRNLAINSFVQNL